MGYKKFKKPKEVKSKEMGFKQFKKPKEVKSKENNKSKENGNS